MVHGGVVRLEPRRYAPLRAIDGHELPIAEDLRGRTGANHAGNAQLATHDRRVASDASTVGDERRRATDGRNPIRRSHRCHEHLAVPQEGAFLWSVQNANVSVSRARGRPEAADEQLSVAQHSQGGDRSRLDEIPLSAFLGPFDVLWSAVVLLDHEPEASEFENLVVGEYAPRRFGVGELHTSVRPVGPPHDLEGLLTHADLEQPWSFLGHGVGIRLDLATHHDFAQAEGSFYDDARRVAGRWVSGEQDA